MHSSILIVQQREIERPSKDQEMRSETWIDGFGRCPLSRRNLFWLRDTFSYVSSHADNGILPLFPLKWARVPRWGRPCAAIRILADGSKHWKHSHKQNRSEFALMMIQKNYFALFLPATRKWKDCRHSHSFSSGFSWEAVNAFLQQPCFVDPTKSFEDREDWISWSINSFSTVALNHLVLFRNQASRRKKQVTKKKVSQMRQWHHQLNKHCFSFQRFLERNKEEIPFLCIFAASIALKQEQITLLQPLKKWFLVWLMCLFFSSQRRKSILNILWWWFPTVFFQLQQEQAFVARFMFQKWSLQCQAINDFIWLLMKRLLEIGKAFAAGTSCHWF